MNKFKVIGGPAFEELPQENGAARGEPKTKFHNDQRFKYIRWFLLYIYENY